jgi:hypothetical protein
MIDKITIFVPHILMALMIWKLVHRPDLDDDPALPNRRQPLLGHRATRFEADDRRPDA